MKFPEVYLFSCGYFDVATGYSFAKVQIVQRIILDLPMISGFIIEGCSKEKAGTGSLAGCIHAFV